MTARENLTNYLAVRLAEGCFQVVPRDQIRKRIAEQKKDSYQECYDEGCQIELGRELAAQKSLATQVLKLGGACQLTSALYDLRKSTAEQAATEECGCLEKELLNAVRRLVDKLCQNRGAKPIERPLPAPGKVEILTVPTSTFVSIDGEPPALGPLTRELAAGEHRIKVSAAGHRDREQRLQVEPGKTTRAILQLQKRSALNAWGHGLFWGGLAESLLGALFKKKAQTTAEAFNHGNFAEGDASRKWMVATYAAVGVGGALALTGCVLWLLAPGDPGAPEVIGPGPDAQGATLGWGGGW